MQFKLLKSTQIPEKQSSLGPKIWLFQHSLYQIHIFNTANPHPHYKICLESQVQHFEIIENSNQSYVVVIGNTGTWVGYQLVWEGKIVGAKQVCQGVMESVEERVVGVHLVDSERMMVVFVKDNGKLEYNYLRNVKMETLKINKTYKTEPQNQKYQKSNLFSKYRGRQLLCPESENESKVIQSCFNLPTSELYVVVEDFNSKICSIFKFFLQAFEVISGSDFLLNLECRPSQIILFSGIVVINLGKEMILWARYLTQAQKYGEEGFCTSLAVIDKQKLIACLSKQAETVIYTIAISQSKQEKSVATVQHQKIHALSSQLIHYMPLQFPKPQPAIGISSKLQILLWDQEKSFKTLLPNMEMTIQSANLYSSQYGSYFNVVKKVGYNIESKIVTNNRIVTHVDEYQHNMLIKMANLVAFGVKEETAELCLSSPILGTLKLAIGYKEETVSISMAGMAANLSSQEESLFLEADQNQQVTPTKLSLAKSRYSILDMFEGKIDFILAACIVGNYALLAVERQVHIFTLEPKPKRLHIFCLDSELRMLVGLNDVSLWGALLWDGSMIVLRIQEKESVKVKEINQIGYVNSQNCLQFKSVINTAPYKSTLIGNHLFIVSNDPLHVYQPEKTIIKVFPLSIQDIGQQYWPLIEIPSSGQAKQAQKFKIISKKDNAWCIIGFPTKCLVKDVEEIKMEIEMIIGFPSVEDLIAATIKDNVMALLCGSRIVTCVLQTGSITYRSTSTFQEKPSKANQSYLAKWMSKQELTPQTLHLEDPNPILSSNPGIIRLSESRLALYNSKQIWYCSLEINGNRNNIKLISYFSIPNDAFLQFRNNLSISELENDAFMEIFAQKLPILEAAKINQFLLAVLYSKMIVITEIKPNGALTIKQQLLFTEYPELISITHFLGHNSENSLYLKDISNRLILLKPSLETKKYTLQILEQLEDQIVCVQRVNGWKDAVKKMSFNGEIGLAQEEVIVKRDGQLVVGHEGKAIYL